MASEPGPDTPADAPPTHEKYADLVLEGGGVKGVALVGAAVALHDAGYSFARVAGSSAGAIVGSIIAAMECAHEPMSRADDIARSLDYRQMQDRRTLSRLVSPWTTLANAVAVYRHWGVYRGKYLLDWITGVLGDLGVHTFDDLRFDDPGSALGRGRSYRLVVTASDLSRQRLMYLPWDLSTHEVEPDSFSVGRAVRASAGIPFMFEPVKLKTVFGSSLLVDGSILRSYPLEVFDRDDGLASRWPTIGVRLSTLSNDKARAKPVTGPVSLALKLVETTIDSTQVRYIRDPENVDRSIFAKSSGVRSTDFDVTSAQNQALYEAGYAAGERWLATHDNAELPHPDRRRTRDRIDVDGRS